MLKTNKYMLAVSLGVLTLAMVHSVQAQEIPQIGKTIYTPNLEDPHGHIRNAQTELNNAQSRLDGMRGAVIGGSSAQQNQAWSDQIQQQQQEVNRLSAEVDNTRRRAVQQNMDANLESHRQADTALRVGIQQETGLNLGNQPVPSYLQTAYQELQSARSSLQMNEQMLEMKKNMGQFEPNSGHQATMEQQIKTQKEEIARLEQNLKQTAASPAQAMRAETAKMGILQAQGDLSRAQGAYAACKSGGFVQVSPTEWGAPSCSAEAQAVAAAEQHLVGAKQDAQNEQGKTTNMAGLTNEPGKAMPMPAPAELDDKPVALTPPQVERPIVPARDDDLRMAPVPGARPNPINTAMIGATIGAGTAIAANGKLKEWGSRAGTKLGVTALDQNIAKVNLGGLGNGGAGAKGGAGGLGGELSKGLSKSIGDKLGVKVPSKLSNKVGDAVNGALGKALEKSGANQAAQKVLDAKKKLEGKVAKLKEIKGKIDKAKKFMAKLGKLGKKLGIKIPGVG